MKKASPAESVGNNGPEDGCGSAIDHAILSNSARFSDCFAASLVFGAMRKVSGRSPMRNFSVGWSATFHRSRNRAVIMSAFVLTLHVHWAAGRIQADESSDAFFESKIRPLLVTKCLECHGDEEPEGGLRLTSREAILKGGASGPAAQIEDPGRSLMIRSVRRQGRIKMPPAEPLAENEIAMLEAWVVQGLPWTKSGSAPLARTEFAVTEADRSHWAFRAMANPALPGVNDGAWTISSVDRFILSKLESAGVRPAPESDRRTLLRRATYDLTGLPPSSEEVDAFLTDEATTEEAFRRVVDRLLASPRYGERWGRHWLDVARFADSKDGVLMFGDDRIRPYAYTYRDYVIRAFNEDTPFDQFVREQIAADQIEPRVPPWRLAALGFLTLGRMYDNNVHDVIDDQIDTVTRGFLGLTIACARCHDHKYDPVSTADYYGLYGVFASCETPLDLPMTVDEVSLNTEDFEKQAALKRDEIRKFLDAQFEKLSEIARQRTDDYLVHVATTKPDPLENTFFFLSLTPDELRPQITSRWRRFIERRVTPDDPVFGLWHELMQLAEPGKTPLVGPDGGPTTFAAGAARVIAARKSRPVGTKPKQDNPRIREALASAPLSSRADVARAYGQAIEKAWADAKATRGEAKPGDASEPESVAIAQLIELIDGPESPASFPRSMTRRYMSRTDFDKFGEMIQELDRMAVKSPDAAPRAMVLVDSDKPCDPHVFVRGNPSALGKRVERQFPRILASSDAKPFANGSGRLELAESIASASNPLTARVFVNRVWMHHFGEPLVASPSDFGTRVAEPVHIELLDHLATSFVRDGWSVKNLHRRIMNSRVYMLASTYDDDGELRAADPENHLFGRANRQRLSFEAMRDTLLTLSGRLEFRSGGQPVDVTDPQIRCRTVFGLVDRQNVPGVFRAFDFASPDLSVERRVRTMGPQQTLFALNSPLVIEQAKFLAARPEVATAVDATSRTKALYRIVFQRDPLNDEIAAALEFVKMPAASRSKLSVWEQFAQVLLSTNELMYVD